MSVARRHPRAAVAAGLAATALGLAALLGGVGLLGYGAGGVVAGLAVAGGVAAVGRESPRAVVGGTALLALGGVVLVGAAGAAHGSVADASVGRHRGLVVVGAWLATLGAASPWCADPRSVRAPAGASLTAAVGLILTAVLVGGASAGGTVGDALGSLGGWLLDVLVWRDGPVTGAVGRRLEYALATLALLVAVTVHSVAFAASRLDVARVLRRDRRPAVRERLHRAAARADRVARVAGVCFALALALALLPVPLPYGSAGALPEAALRVVGASALRWPLVLVAASVWSLLLAARLGLYLAHLLDARRWRRLPAVLGGVGVWLAVVLLGGAVGESVVVPALAERGAAGASLPLSSVDLGTAVAELSTLEGAGRAAAQLGLAALATGVLLGVLATAGSLELVDGPSSGGAVAAAGLVAGSVGAGALAARPAAVVVPVAAAFVVWDAARYGAGVAREVGPDVDATDSLLAHLAGTTAVGIAALVLALATATLVAGAATPALRVPTVIALLAGLVLSLEVLRRLADEPGWRREVSLSWPLAPFRRHPTAAALVAGAGAALALRRSAGLEPGATLVAGAVSFAVVWIALAGPGGEQDAVVEETAD